MSRYSCSFAGQCVQNYRGLYASLEECQADCQAREAKALNYLIYQYASNEELLELALEDQLELISQNYQIRLTPKEVDWVVQYLDNLIIRQAVENEGLLPLVQLVKIPGAARKLTQDNVWELVQQHGLELVRLILDEPDANILINLPFRSIPNLFGYNQFDPTHNLYGRPAFANWSRAHCSAPTFVILDEIDEDAFDEESIPVEQLTALVVQHFGNQVQRGDLIRFYYGDRNDGVAIFDGEQVQYLATEPDEYGLVPSNFHVNNYPCTYYWGDGMTHNSHTWLDTSKLNLESVQREQIEEHVTLLRVEDYLIYTPYPEETMDRLQSGEVVLFDYAGNLYDAPYEVYAANPRILYDTEAFNRADNEELPFP